MVKKAKKTSKGETAEETIRLRDVPIHREAELHTTQINVAPEAFERFSDIFENAVARWEHIVYPAMIVMAFVFAYGFFLMFSLSNDMRRISEGFDPNMGKHMGSLVKNMGKLTNSIHEMHEEMKIIAKVMPAMDKKLIAMKEMAVMSEQVRIMNQRMLVMNAHMDGMNKHMRRMNRRMAVMTHSVSDMNRNIGPPLSFMNSIMPW